MTGLVSGRLEEKNWAFCFVGGGVAVAPCHPLPYQPIPIHPQFPSILHSFHICLGMWFWTT